MSSVNYKLDYKGVELIPAEKAWIKGKNGKMRLSRDYTYVGRIDTHFSPFILSCSEDKKPSFRGNVGDLSRRTKNQLVAHFFDDDGKRNRRTVAYFGVKKKK